MFATPETQNVSDARLSKLSPLSLSLFLPSTPGTPGNGDHYVKLGPCQMAQSTFFHRNKKKNRQSKERKKKRRTYFLIEYLGLWWLWCRGYGTDFKKGTGGWRMWVGRVTTHHQHHHLRWFPQSFDGSMVDGAQLFSLSAPSKTTTRRRKKNNSR